jgi:hypothetical protein
MRRRKALARSVVLACSAWLISSSVASASCSPTPLSQAEGHDLVMGIPAAIAARASGGHVSAVPSGPKRRLFYTFMLLTDGKQPPTLLDNGLLGYFAVNRITGRVVEATAGEETMRGETLDRLQSRLRSEHCINDALVKKYEAVSPNEATGALSSPNNRWRGP